MTIKTSVQFQTVTPWASNALRDIGAQWVKFINPPSGADPCPQVPNKVIRIWTDDRDAAYIVRGREGGKQFVKDMLPVWNRCRWASPCYELANEPSVSGAAALANLREYTLGAMMEADAQGIKLCILNIAEGNPGADPGLTGDAARASERWKLAQLVDAVGYACDHGHYVGLHAYWRPGVEGPDGRWHALGRRVWDVEQWSSMGVDVSRLQVLINETGIDGGIAGGPAKHGWRSLSNRDAYLAEMVQAEVFARRYSWLKALLYFVSGNQEWDDFEVDDGLLREAGRRIAALPAVPTPVPVPTEGAVIKIDGRCLTVAQFQEHVKALDMGPVTTVVIHHTAAPDEAKWRQYGGKYWMQALKTYYEGKGWDAGPHLFVSDEGIWLFTPLGQDGVGVIGHNAKTRHIEIVGNYMDHLPQGATLTNAVQATAIVLQRAGLTVAALDYHRNLQSDTTCPGDALVNRWGWFRDLVKQAIAPALAYLPENEPAQDAPTLASKCRWWLEEEQRQREAGQAGRANEIRLSLIKLLYRLENALKAA